MSSRFYDQRAEIWNSIEQNKQALTIKENTLLGLKKSIMELEVSIDQLRETITDQTASLAPFRHIPAEILHQQKKKNLKETTDTSIE